ncbi:hypothetical protein ATANTOWER_005257 [Ataeniobius toweri]|uniref:Uncharacterized protein n=1 Tax=Ataeniobius toweri TaxID=208326 RepID=A0ABU7AWM0_9TELE|nr:hypothetical protein [Ataeniobius toweri]
MSPEPSHECTLSTLQRKPPRIKLIPLLQAHTEQHQLSSLWIFLPKTWIVNLIPPGDLTTITHEILNILTSGLAKKGKQAQHFLLKGVFFGEPHPNTQLRIIGDIPTFIQCDAETGRCTQGVTDRFYGAAVAHQRAINLGSKEMNVEIQASKNLGQPSTCLSTLPRIIVSPWGPLNGVKHKVRRTWKYFSPLLHPPVNLNYCEKNYDVGDRELLAIKTALEEGRYWLEDEGQTVCGSPADMQGRRLSEVGIQLRTLCHQTLDSWDYLFFVVIGFVIFAAGTVSAWLMGVVMVLYERYIKKKDDPFELENEEEGIEIEDFDKPLQKLTVLEMKIHRLEVNVEVNMGYNDDSTLPVIPNSDSQLNNSAGNQNTENKPTGRPPGMF